MLDGLCGAGDHGSVYRLVDGEGPSVAEALCRPHHGYTNLGHILIIGGYYNVVVFRLEAQLSKGFLVVNLPFLVDNLHYFSYFCYNFGYKVRQFLLILQEK